MTANVVERLFNVPFQIPRCKWNLEVGGVANREGPSPTELALQLCWRIARELIDNETGMTTYQDPLRGFEGN